MHTMCADQGTLFHYNSDLSGDVHVQTQNGDSLDIPGHDLLCFAAHWVQLQRIRELENASDAALLGIPEEAMP